MQIAAFSDTHTQHRQVTIPLADVAIFAGDLMGSGYRHSEVKDFGKWFSDLPHANKILVVGNHDRLFESNKKWCLEQFSKDVVYLENDHIIINGLKVYGSPVQPEFFGWAFNVPRGTQIKKYWDNIPDDTDVLVTHGPPMGILDRCIPGDGTMTYSQSDHLGCEELRKVVDRIAPKVHIFGHIHGSYGVKVLQQVSENRKLATAFHNVSICNEKYEAVNQPHVIEG
jgi:Icc-related predicted phosphoesterase